MRKKVTNRVRKLLILTMTAVLMAGCGAKSSDNTEASKSIGDELFPGNEGVLATLEMVQAGVQNGGGSATANQEDNKEDKKEEAAAESVSTEAEGGETPAAAEAEADSGNKVVLDVGFITEITDTISSPDDMYGEYITINDAFGKPHDVAINCMEGYEDSSTYEWYMSYDMENGTSYVTNVTGDKLEYMGLYYFGVDTEEVSVIITAVDKEGQPHTLIGTYYYYDDGMYWRYWTTDGSVNQGHYTPMDGAFEGYDNGTVTVGGTKYKLGDDLTLIPN